MDNQVLLRLDKPIENDELDIILMYLENKNKSNGGNIINHEYDKTNQTLNLTYETQASKNGVLNKKFHKILEYSLFASEHVKSKNDLMKIGVDKQQKKNFKAIILSNILSNEDSSLLTLYAEYLVPDNEIIEVKSSKIFKDTFIIEFKEEVNYEQVLKRYLKRSSLRNQPVKLYQANETNSYFIQNPFDLQQQNLKTSDSFFVYIETMKVHLAINSNEMMINNAALEKFYSFEQLRDLLPEILIEIKQEPHEIPLMPVEVKKEPQSFKFIEITVENPLFVALSNCKQILADFDKNLNKINACLRQINEKVFKIEYIKNSSLQTEDHDSWLEKVEYIIENFEKFINFAQIKFTTSSLPKNAEDTISMLIKNKTDLHIYINNSFVIMIGYENSVKYSYNIIANALQQQQQQPQVPLNTPKRTLQIDIEPLISTLMNCGDFFNEIQTILKNENAKLGPKNTNIVPIGPVMNENFWMNCVRERFNQFIIQNIKLHQLQIPANMIKDFGFLIERLGRVVNRQRVHYFLENTSFHIIGFHEEVNKMIVNLNSEIQLLDRKQPTVNTVANGDDLFTIQIEEILYKSLLFECKTVYEDLNTRLKSVNAQFSSSGIQTLMVQQIQKVENQSKNEWSAKVTEILQKFFQIQIVISKLDVKYFDVNLIKKFKSDAKNERTLNFVYKLNPPNEVIFCGFKRSVNRIVSFLTEAIKPLSTVQIVEQQPQPISKPQPQIPPPTTIKDEIIDIDYYVSQTLVKCPQLYSKLSQKLGGSNGMLVYNPTKEKIEIVRKNRGRNSDKWAVLNRKVLNLFKSKNVKTNDYALRSIENFNEELLKNLKGDLTTLRSKCKDNFMFFIDQNTCTLKIISDPSVLKETTEFIKQYFLNSKSTSTAKLQSSLISSLPVINNQQSIITSNLPEVENLEKIVIDVGNQPKLPVLFAFNKVFLNELVQKLEKKFNARCIIDESIKKPSKASIVIQYQQMIAAAASGFDEWKHEVLEFVGKYFDRFKQVRLTISDSVYTSISKDLSPKRFASLKRLNRNAFEIIGSNEEVDKLMNQIKTLENNNNDAVSSSFFDKF